MLAGQYSQTAQHWPDGLDLSEYAADNLIK
jgi:hypothetical protein